MKKKQPLRTCIGCKEKRAKKDLIRVVSGKNRLLVDTTNRKHGRGAYFCKDSKCTQKGLKKTIVDKALKTNVKDEDLSKVKDEINKVIKEND